MIVNCIHRINSKNRINRNENRHRDIWRKSGRTGHNERQMQLEKKITLKMSQGT